MPPFQVPFPKFVHAAGGDVDQADAEVKPLEEIGREVANGAAAGVKPGGVAETLVKPRRFRNAKQSGVPCVNWDNINWAWQVQFPRLNEKGKAQGKTNRTFLLSKFMKQGLSEAEAEVAALEAAKAFRSDLVKQGILKEAKPVDPNFTSEVVGVSWDKQSKKWRVWLYPTGKKRIYGGSFTEKSAAEAKALELAKEHGLERRVKAVSTFSERFAGLPIFKPKVPYPGVYWEQRSQKWHAQCQINGAKRNFYAKPKDHSEVELEASFQKAVAWKKKQENEREKNFRNQWTPTSPVRCQG